MQALINFWKNHGDKIFANLTGIQLLLQAANPAILAGIFGAKAPLWIAFATAIVTAYHTVFENPTTPVLTAQIVANNAASDAKLATKVKAFFPLLVVGACLAIAHGLSGCAASSTKAAPTFNDLVLNATDLDTAAAGAVGSLATSKTISSSTANAVLKITDAINAALVLANTADQANNQTTAVAKFTAAMAALGGVQACLLKPATLVTCLSGVTAP